MKSRGIPPFAKNAEDGAPDPLCRARNTRLLFALSLPVQQLPPLEAPPSPLSSRPKRSAVGEICGSAALPWICFRPSEAEWRDLRLLCRRGPQPRNTRPRNRIVIRPEESWAFTPKVMKNWVLFGNHTQWKRHPPLCHLDRSVAQWRDLRSRGPFLGMFFDRAYPDFLLRAASDVHVCGSP